MSIRLVHLVLQLITLEVCKFVGAVKPIQSENVSLLSGSWLAARLSGRKIVEVFWSGVVNKEIFLGTYNGNNA